MAIIEINNKNYRIDGKQITFLDQRFYYTESGAFLPSVTSILESYPKGPAYYEWVKKHGPDSDDIRDEAGRRGSVVHNLTEMYDQGMDINLFDNNGQVGYKLSEWAMLGRYAEFRQRHPFEIIYSEQNLVCEPLGYAGTIDRIIKINGELWLIDIKTSGAIYNSYWLQVAAYKAMAELMLKIKIDKVGILWLNAKTRSVKEFQGEGYQLVTRADTSKDMALFNATKQLWIEENGSMKPKQTSYQLSFNNKNSNNNGTIS